MAVISLRFSKLLIAESIPSPQTQTGHLLYKNLEPLPALLQRPIVIEYRAIRGADDLLSRFTSTWTKRLSWKGRLSLLRPPL